MDCCFLCFFFSAIGTNLVVNPAELRIGKIMNGTGQQKREDFRIEVKRLLCLSLEGGFCGEIKISAIIENGVIQKVTSAIQEEIK